MNTYGKNVIAIPAFRGNTRKVETMKGRNNPYELKEDTYIRAMLTEDR